MNACLDSFTSNSNRTGIPFCLSRRTIGFVISWPSGAISLCILIFLSGHANSAQFQQTQTKDTNRSTLTISDYRAYDNRELHDLMVGANDQKALYASWVRLIRDAKKAPGAAIQRYFGFLEGRLQAKIPKTWERLIREARFDKAEPKIRLSEPLPFVKASDALDVAVTSPFQMQKTEEHWQIVGKDIVIPLRNFNEDSGSIRFGSFTVWCSYLAAVATTDRDLIIGFASFKPRPYPLIRIDRHGKLLWKTSVQCVPPPEPDNLIFVGFVEEPAVEVVLTSKRIVVFGVAQDTAYIEGFDAESGANLFRFSSSDWK